MFSRKVIVSLHLLLSLCVSSAPLWAQDTLQPPQAQLPFSDSTSLKKADENSDAIPQSSVLWRYPYTPIKARLSVFFADQAGGPIRFNTRFPEVKGDPHPASYFHSLPAIGGEFEYATKRGGLLIGAILRRDLWHPGIKKRSVSYEDKAWMVDEFTVNSSAFLMGWIFGSRYREAPWSADMALIYDRGSADTILKSEDGVKAVGQVSIDAISIRSRIHFNTTQSGSFNLGAGPELHVPVWSSTSNQSDEIIGGLIEKNIELKSTAALGFSLLSSFRF